VALEGFVYVSDQIQNDVTYWRGEGYLKCKSGESTTKNYSLM